MAQSQSFQFLRIADNAVVSGLGGVNVSMSDKRVNFFQSNPALAGDTLNGWGSASYLFYLANTGMASFSYLQDFKKIGAVSFGTKHLALGQIQGYDAAGNATGKFNAGETAVMVGKSHQINHFRLGLNVKGVFSTMAGYRANALLFDLGGVFIHPAQDLQIGLVIKDVGFLLSEYSETSSTQLPFDMQMGISFKPEHMPVRFSMTAYHLTDFDISYDNSTLDADKRDTFDQVMAHFNFGAEALVHKNASLLLGYNVLKHQELKLENGGGGSGVSVGLQAKTKNMNVSVSRTGYVIGGAYQVSLSAAIQRQAIRK